MAVARVGVLLSVLAVLGSRPAFALPLQEIMQRAEGRVAHLSVRDAQDKELSSGSGFIVSNDGRLATNFHVVEEAERIVAVFSDGREVKVVGTRGVDQEVDIAVLQLEKGEYPRLELAQGPATRGQEIVVIGSPLGLGDSVSTGIVSAVRERGTLRGENEGRLSWALQLTAPVAPGSSGSPILNNDAEVVGLAVGMAREAAGISFGIPVARLEAILARGSADVTPLPKFQAGRTIRTNLLISGAFFGVVAFIWWLVSYLQTRALRRRARTRLR